MSHTPGPWYVSRDAVPEWHRQFTVYEEQGDKVATAFLDESNANLIAASPDLLDALEMAEGFMSGFEDDEVQEGINEKLATIRAAIKLAKTGER